MREIKFRAFIHETGMIEDVTSINFVDGELFHVYISDLEDVYYTYGNQFTFIQYTGLKDKNGREIYENDVVQRILMAPSSRLINEDFIGQVKFLEGAWLIDNCRDAIPLWSESDELVVLGNIHDNPELLGDSK